MMVLLDLMQERITTCVGFVFEKSWHSFLYLLAINESLSSCSSVCQLSSFTYWEPNYVITSIVFLRFLLIVSS